jgi:hypothetical protein
MTMLPADLKPGDYIVEISYQYGEDLYARLRVPIKVDEPQVKTPAKTAKPLPNSQKPPAKKPAPPGSKPLPRNRPKPIAPAAR